MMEAIRCCTATPARTLGLAGRIGTLAPGALADVAIFRLKDKERRVGNLLNESVVVPKLLVPQLTILDGKVVFRQIDF